MTSPPQATWTWQSSYQKYRLPLAGLIAGFLALTLIPHSLYNNPDFGLDSSWYIALHYALKNQLVFGKDFIFNYGPLGVLSTRLSIGVHESVYILFDVFLISNFFFVFYRIITKNNLPVASILIFICIWLLQRDPAIILLWLVLFFLFDYLETRNIVVLINMIVIAAISFFVKGSTAFVPPVFAFFGMVYAIRSKLISYPATTVVIASYFSLLLIGAYALNVDLILYVVNVGHIIGGYPEAMYVLKSKSGANPALEWALLYIVIFAGTGIYFIKRILKSEFLILVFLCCSLFLFVLFRAAFTRFHIESFFSFTTPLYGLVFLHAAREMKRFMSIGIWISVVISVWATGIIVNPDFLYPVNTVRLLANDIGYYYQLGTHYPGNSPEYSSQPEDLQLPKRMMDSIGNQSVDIIPWDIAVLTSKGMNYKGRPIIQSYCVHDGHLDQLNADFYKSSARPEYILYKSDEIDGRCGMFDETLMKLELLKNYTTIDTNWNHILLKRLKRPLTSSVVKKDSGSIKFDQEISVVAGSELQVGYVNAEYSLFGKVVRTLYQPPDLSVTLYLEDNTEVSFRCSQRNARDGMIINRYVPNNAPAELALFVNSNGSQSKKIKALRFFSDFPSGYKGTINYRIEHHKFEDQTKSLTAISK